MSPHNRTCAKCGKSSEGKNIKVHRFPIPKTTQIIKATAWATYCWPDQDWSSLESLTSLATKNKVICSNHFEDSCYTDNSRTHLTKYAVPGKKEYVIKTLQTLRSKLSVPSIVQQINLSQDPLAGGCSKDPVSVTNKGEPITCSAEPLTLMGNSSLVDFPVAGCSKDVLPPPVTSEPSTSMDPAETKTTKPMPKKANEMLKHFNKCNLSVAPSAMRMAVTMASLLQRVKLRFARLTQTTAETKLLIERSDGVSEEEFTMALVKLKLCISAFEKELYQYLSAVPEADVGQMTLGQFEAEDLLTQLEATKLLNKRSTEQTTSKSKLPELGLPSFSGDRLKWWEFWDRFSATVDSRSLQDSEKLMYLLSCLKDAALDTISGLTATNANYSVAVETLKSRFGSEDLLVDAHYTALTILPKADSSSSGCRKTLDHIEQNIRVLEKLGEPVSGNSLRALVLSKFPDKVVHEHHLIGGGTDLPSIRQSLDRIITAMEKSNAFIPLSDNAVPSTSSTTEALQIRTETRTISGRKRKRPAPTSAPPAKKTKKACLFCNVRGHASSACRKYSTVEARQKQVAGRCLHCLQQNHTTTSCRRKISCFRCKGDHLVAFCPNPKPPSNGEKPDQCGPIESLCATSNSNKFLQTAVATLQNPQTRRSYRGRLLLDCGSQRSYITLGAARKLNLPTLHEDHLLIFTFGASEPQKTSAASTTVNIETKRNITKQLSVNIVPRITDRVPVTSLQHPGVDILADDDSVGEVVDLLIGNDFFGAVLRGNKIRVSENFYLLDTDFGWVPSGETNREETSEVLSVVTYCQCHTPSCPYFSEPDLPLRNIDVKFLWSLENLGITDSPKATRQDEAVRHFNDTVKYQDGRYLVKWPWIDYPPDLPSNFGLALGRLKSILRRLDEESRNEYDSILKEQLELGIIEVVDKGSDVDGEHPIHYLGHHLIRKQDGGKGRIVYDASAKCAGQRSLNECLYSGPSMLEDLTALLLKFRTKRYGILADVEKAFLQVALQEDDRDVTRFLWIKDTSSEATEDNLLYLRFRRIPFGVVASPFLLTATIRHYISQTNKSLLKQVADKCYVDNLVTGADTLQEAKQIYDQTRTTFEQLSMNMRDWLSNNQSLMGIIPPEQHKSVKQDSAKVLGLVWKVNEDKLKLNLTKEHFNTDPPVDTKRKVLQTLARVYDPCGFVCPLMLSMKLIFQNTCEMKYKWDTELPADVIQSVKNVMEGLKVIAETEVPRFIGTDSSNSGLKYHLHCFTDASKDAYAAVVYLKVVEEGQGKSISLIMAKSHVSQTKDKDDLKIPKLELLGFLIGSRLLKYIRRHLDLDIEKDYLWSDSLVVHGWMRSNKLLPPFVANRVNEIKRDQPNTEMLYVHTKSNPADIATRPELFQEKRQLWFNGPEFLMSEESCWPQNRLYEAHQNLLSVGEVLGDSHPGEWAHEVAVDTGIDQDEQSSSIEPDVEPMEVQSSSVPAENHEYPTGGPMELDNLDNHTKGSDHRQTSEAKMVCEIRELQKRHFQDELNGKRTHLARNLDLFVDVDGILRCRGRMANTTWSYDMKYPILLPKDSEFTDRLIRDTHERNYHVGAPHTLNIIRERYWIPQGKARVLKVIRRCAQCIKHGGGPYRLPDTPALPPERVNYNRPFTYTGVDYLGPLFVSTPTGKEKRWVALFTCLTVRAIHLEIVKDLTAEECLLALRRFVAARNKPQKMYSDNATCFKLVSEVVQQPYCIENGIQWRFIPQLAPWHGGFYERLVALVKHCLKRTLEKHLLSDTRLLTVIKEVETVLNSRPLTRVGTEIEHVLCPADFLSLGQCVTMTPSAADTPVSDTATKTELVDSWKRGCKILEEYKRMFIGQYLASLRERYNNSPKQPRIRSQRTPQVGDLVQIKSDLKNRNLWKVGKINELVLGQDGECRVAKVKVDDSTLTRSIGHLYPLEVDDETPKVPVMRDLAATEEEPVDADVPGNRDRLDDCPDVEAEPTADCEEATRPSEAPLLEEQQEGRGDERIQRAAAIRARGKILEWTRHLLALLQ